MIVARPLSLGFARVVIRVGVIGSAVMLALSGWAMLSPRIPWASAVGTDAGGAVVITPLDGTSGAGVPITTGGSATKFSLRLPTGAACTGDSANDGYRVQSYMVRESVAPSSLTFDSQGPIPFLFGAEFSQPLYDAGGSTYAGAQTADAAPPPGPGPVINVPAFAFAVFAPGEVGPGTYNVGIACTKGVASATQLDKFWNVTMVIAASVGDLPAGVTWTAVASQTTTTTTGATTTTNPGGTTTTRATTTSTQATSTQATSTTVAGATTTVAGSATTTATSTPAAGAAASGQLARSGGGSISLIAWAFALLVLGRMAVLVARSAQARSSAPR